MASNTGKKGKKNKEKKLSLQDFLAVSAPASSGGTTQVAVSKVSSWAEECEDDDDHKKIEFIQLPTAPRAARILDDDSIPQDPPFRARVANLPFDINEGDVDEFFSDNHIQIREMKLARDEQQDRLRGYGIIEFEAREDLMDALMLTDPTIRGRRIRLELTSDSDTVSGRTVRKRYDNFTPRDSANESTNWRERKESNFETVESRGGDRDGDRRDGNRRSYQPRSNFQNRHENDSRNNNSGEEGGGSNWRLGERNNLGQQDSPPAERKRFGGNNRRFGNNDRGGGERNDRNDRNDRSDRREPRDSPMEERPKLNIAPRTLPLPELNFPKEEELERGTRKISLNGDKESHDDSGLPEDDKDVDDKEVKVDAPKPKPVPKANIFGLAKPVDTAAREKEIEEKREQERSEQARVDKERREKERDEPEREDIEKKDVIVIRTESSRRQDETTNWRKRDDAPATNGSSMDNKTRGGQRQIGRPDDRPRSFNNKDNRDNRSFNNRDRGDRDYRSSGGTGMNRDRRDNNQRGGGGGGNRSSDYGGPRRDNYAGNDMRRDDREVRESKEVRETREPRRDMPKFVENTGTKLQVSNAFAGLDDEVDAD